MSWNDRYDSADYLFGTAPAPFVVAQARHLPPGSKVLAVADGEGRNSVHLARQGHQVTAFDISENALAKARKLAEAQGAVVDFQLSGVADWPWTPGSCDAIAAIFIQFFGPDERAALFRQFDAALRPGGVLLLHGFAPRQVGYGTGGPPNPENMYTLDLLRASFPGYSVLHQDDYDAANGSGGAHGGVAGLIDFVARKPVG